MKQLLFTFLWIVSSFTLHAQQTDMASIREINFYGVDFSKVKLFAVSETPSEMQKGLAAINNLFLSEPKKYDIEKYMKKIVLSYDLDPVNENNRNMDKTQMMSNSKKNELSFDEVQAIVNQIAITEDPGTGLVFIAECLDKSGPRGTYQVVFFDEATKQIIYSKRVSEKGGGAGIRNYWASTVSRLLKNWKY